MDRSGGEDHQPPPLSKAQRMTQRGDYEDFGEGEKIVLRTEALAEFYQKYECSIVGGMAAREEVDEIGEDPADRKPIM